MSETASNATCPNCAKLQERIVALEARIAELEARLAQNSSNSSLPPSSDQPWSKKTPAKEPSGRKPGGQPGHAGCHRERLPVERVKTFVHYHPKHCAHCHAALPDQAGPNDPPPSWHQVAELPPQVAEVTEYQGHARTCPCCGTVTRADIPEAIRAHAIGPNLAATLSFMSGRCHCGKRAVQEISETIFDVPVSLGTVVELEQEMSRALEPAHQEALEAVRAAPVKNVDETGWSKQGKICWLWAAATHAVAAFQVHAKRGKDGLQALLGEVQGIICSDRWGAYAHLPLSGRQICWAHLKRDFQKLADLDENTKVMGQAGLEAVKDVFGVWKDFKNGEIARVELRSRLQPARMRLQDALVLGSQGTDDKTKRFCRRMLKVYDALWTFAVIEGVEPTNNHAERMVRPGVLWRKRSFGNHSDDGCRFTERILTTVQTLRLQKRPVLDYLRRAVVACRAGNTTPALLTG